MGEDRSAMREYATRSGHWEGVLRASPIASLVVDLPDRIARRSVLFRSDDARRRDPR